MAPLRSENTLVVYLVSKANCPGSSVHKIDQATQELRLCRLFYRLIVFVSLNISTRQYWYCGAESCIRHRKSNYASGVGRATRVCQKVIFMFSFSRMLFCTYWEEECVTVLAIDSNLEDSGTCDSPGSVTVTLYFIYLIVLYQGVLFPTLQQSTILYAIPSPIILCYIYHQQGITN